MKNKIKLLFIASLVLLSVSLVMRFIFNGNMKSISSIKKLSIPEDTTYILTNYIQNNGITPDEILKTEFLFINKSGHVTQKYIIDGKSYRSLREKDDIYFINNNSIEGYKYNLNSREFSELDENTIVSKVKNNYSDIIYELKNNGKIKEEFQCIYEDIKKKGDNYYFIGGDSIEGMANKNVFIYDSLKCETTKLNIKIDRIKDAIEINNKHYIKGEKINRQLTDKEAQNTPDDIQIFVYDEENSNIENITLEELENIKENNSMLLGVFDSDNRFVNNDEYILICNKVNNHNKPIEKNIIINKDNRSIDVEEIDMIYYTAKQISLNDSVGAIYGVDNINPPFILRIDLDTGKTDYVFIKGINKKVRRNFSEGINDLIIIE